MPIPDLDRHGLLPRGVHDCTLSDIGEVFVVNPHRGGLFENLINVLHNEIWPSFDEPIYINGSFVTDKEYPEDVDIVLDLRYTSDERKWRGLVFMNTHQKRLLREHQIHFWINLPIPDAGDFTFFFQYVGVKTARFKGLNPKHLKGILRIVQ